MTRECSPTGGTEQTYWVAGNLEGPVEVKGSVCAQEFKVRALSVCLCIFVNHVNTYIWVKCYI